MWRGKLFQRRGVKWRKKHQEHWDVTGDHKSSWWITERTAVVKLCTMAVFWQAHQWVTSWKRSTRAHSISWSDVVQGNETRLSALFLIPDCFECARVGPFCVVLFCNWIIFNNTKRGPSLQYNTHTQKIPRLRDRTDRKQFHIL